VLALLAVTFGAQCTLLTDLDGLSDPSSASPPGDAAGAADGAGEAAQNDAGRDQSAGGDGAQATGYASVVMQDGPIGYWRLGDTVSPKGKDESSGGHDGVYMGGVELAVQGAIAGDTNGAARFDGADDQFAVVLPSTFSFAGKAPFSVEAWVKRTGTKLGILSKGKYNGSAYEGWYLVYNSAGTNVVFFRGGSGAIESPRPVNDRFFHVVATFDGVTLILYVDGNERMSSTGANVRDLVGTDAPLVVGNAQDWGTHAGVVDEVAIYDKPLTPTRVKAHFVAGGGN
jgi:hypothetical protein